MVTGPLSRRRLRVRAPSSSLDINRAEFEMSHVERPLARFGSRRCDHQNGAISGQRDIWSQFTTLPITNTINATAGDHFRAETPAGPVEFRSLRELGDRLRDFLANPED
jgi:hypothetical protein